MPATTGTLQVLDAVEQGEHELQPVDHLGLGLEALELVDVGADDEALLFAGEDDQAA